MEGEGAVVFVPDGVNIAAGALAVFTLDVSKFYPGFAFVYGIVENAALELELGNDRCTIFAIFALVVGVAFALVFDPKKKEN